MIKALAEVCRSAQKEKVFRAALNSLHNMLSYEELALAGDMVEAGLYKVVVTRQMQVSRPDKHTPARAHAHAHAHAHACMHTGAHAHACTRTHPHACTPACMHARTHTRRVMLCPRRRRVDSTSTRLAAWGPGPGARLLALSDGLPGLLF